MRKASGQAMIKHSVLKAAHCGNRATEFLNPLHNRPFPARLGKEKPRHLAMTGFSSH
jgi:hypothetical protein